MNRHGLVDRPPRRCQRACGCYSPQGAVDPTRLQLSRPRSLVVISPSVSSTTTGLSGDTTRRRRPRRLRTGRDGCPLTKPQAARIARSRELPYAAPPTWSSHDGPDFGGIVPLMCGTRNTTGAQALNERPIQSTVDQAGGKPVDNTRSGAHWFLAAYDTTRNYGGARSGGGVYFALARYGPEGPKSLGLPPRADLWRNYRYTTA